MFRGLKEILHLLRQWGEQYTKDKHKLMTALDSLTASVNTLATSITGLTAAVDTAVADITTPGATDAQLASLQSVVDAQTAAVNAQAARLNAATTPVTPPPSAPAAK